MYTRNGLGLRFAVGNAGVVVVDWWLGLADLGVVVAWVCRSRPRLADLFLLSSGVRYIITIFSFPLFSSKSCEFGFVCGVSVRRLVVYGGLVGVEFWMILNGISLVSG
uniref:Transmembrane protein n=1 Tax=Fagus sylvatica TaxID=28930 RepID=A0A2N9IFY1_FAGSY